MHPNPTYQKISQAQIVLFSLFIAYITFAGSGKRSIWELLFFASWMLLQFLLASLGVMFLVEVAHSLGARLVGFRVYSTCWGLDRWRHRQLWLGNYLLVLRGLPSLVSSVHGSRIETLYRVRLVLLLLVRPLVCLGIAVWSILWMPTYRPTLWAVPWWNGAFTWADVVVFVCVVRLGSLLFSQPTEINPGTFASGPGDAVLTLLTGVPPTTQQMIEYSYQLEAHHFLLEAHHFLHKNQREEARRILEEGIALYPHFTFLRENLASVLSSSKEFERAFGIYQELLTSNAPLLQPGVVLGDLLWCYARLPQRSHEVTSFCLQEMKRLDSYRDDPAIEGYVPLVKGQALVQSKQVQEGLKFLQEAAKHPLANQHEDEISLWTALACARLGNTEEAERLLSIAERLLNVPEKKESPLQHDLFVIRKEIMELRAPPYRGGYTNA